MLWASVKVEAVPSATMAAHSITLDRPCPGPRTRLHEDLVMQPLVQSAVAVVQQ
jgi:hypothetical protein